VAATAADIQRTIDTYIATFSATDREAWLALFADDATVEDPVGSEVQTGSEAIGAFWDFVHELSPTVTLHAAGPACIVDGEAAFPITIVNDLGGTLMALDAIDVVTLTDDAKIATLRAYWDMALMHPYEA